MSKEHGSSGRIWGAFGVGGERTVLRLSSENYFPHIRQGVRFLERSFDEQIGFEAFLAPNGNFSRSQQAPPEIFTSLLIAHSLVDVNIRPQFLDKVPKLIQLATNAEGLVHFFYDHKRLEADIDCTAVAYALLLRLGHLPKRLPGIVDRLLANVNEDGIIEVYAQPAGERAGRVDACVLVNALYLLYAVERASEAAPSEALVYQTLKQGAYLAGSRYYPSPDAFLYFLSRLVRDFVDARKQFGGLLMEALFSRRKLRGATVDLSMRSGAMDNVHMNVEKMREIISGTQTHDGRWGAAPLFKYGRSEVFFGSDALSTALSVQALAGR